MGARTHDLDGLDASRLHRFACDCVEHALSDDTPELCREAIAVERRWLESGEDEALEPMRDEVAAAFETERSQWRDSGVPAIALQAVLEALSEDAEAAARGAAALSRKLASQRGFVRSSESSSRGRGDDADWAAMLEHQWQEKALEALRAS